MNFVHDNIVIQCVLCASTVLKSFSTSNFSSGVSMDETQGSTESPYRESASPTLLACSDIMS